MNTPGKRLLLVGSCFLFLAFTCLADAPATSDLTPIEREVKQLHDESQKEVRALVGQFQSKDAKAQEDAFKKYKAIQQAYAGKLMAVSKKDPKDPGTVDALVMVIYMARGTPEAKQADETIKREYLNSPHVTSYCGLLSMDHVNGPKLLKQIAESNPNPDARAAALYCLGRMEAETDPAAADKHLSEVIEKYPKAQSSGLIGAKRVFAEEAKNELFALRNLAIGKPAPEITGEDVDGKKFSLSDYKGKVVVLDFWGDW